MSYNYSLSPCKCGARDVHRLDQCPAFTHCILLLQWSVWMRTSTSHRHILQLDQQYPNRSSPHSTASLSRPQCTLPRLLTAPGSRDTNYLIWLTSQPQINTLHWRPSRLGHSRGDRVMKHSHSSINILILIKLTADGEVCAQSC